MVHMASPGHVSGHMLDPACYCKCSWWPLGPSLHLRCSSSRLAASQLVLHAGRFAVPETTEPADPQLDALLQFKNAIDKDGVLKGWNTNSGANRGYCKWKGVECKDGKVTFLQISTDKGHHGLKGTLPPASALAGLTSLTVIGLHNQTGVSGSVPADWGALVQLEEIVAVNLSLTGNLPSAWSRLRNLKYLELSQNKLTGQLPDSFQNLRQLVILVVFDNQLTGTLPAWLGELKQLEFLYLGGNKFRGQLPDTLMLLKQLLHLHADENLLTGTIPNNLAQLKNLEELWWNGNSLTGTLPDSFKNLMSLKWLNLYDNNLRGSVPSSWSNLKSLEVLWLSYNPHLTGCLPASLEQQLIDKDFDVKHQVSEGTKITGFC